MTSIFFDPVVGVHYGTDQSISKKRIMVVGNSHYCGDCPECGDRSLSDGKCLNFTKNTVELYLNPDESGYWMATYSTFVNSLLGRRSSLEDRRTVFDSIIFYNYLQVSAGEDAYSTNRYDFRDVRHLNAFLEVVDHYRPDVVICWGATVWNVLPDDWGYGEAVKGCGVMAGSKEFRRYQTYPFKNEELLLIGVKHPCIGYSVDFHHQMFSQLIGGLDV